jgi:hypothetical protein
METPSGEFNLFAVSQKERDSRFKNKDGKTCPIIKEIKIPEPASFHAILMPNCYGPELRILSRKGVPDKNIWAIERSAKDLNKMRKVLGVNLLSRPMDADEAIDRIWVMQPKNDLIYLDFFSQPDLPNHYWLFYKIFTLGGGMLKPGGKLVLTYGKNRCRAEAKDLNDILMKNGGWKKVPQHYVDLALEKSGHRPYKSVKIHEYDSGSYKRSHAYQLVLKFVVTEINF